MIIELQVSKLIAIFLFWNLWEYVVLFWVSCPLLPLLSLWLYFTGGHGRAESGQPRPYQVTCQCLFVAVLLFRIRLSAKLSNLVKAFLFSVDNKTGFFSLPKLQYYSGRILV